MISARLYVKYTCLVHVVRWGNLLFVAEDVSNLSFIFDRILPIFLSVSCGSFGLKPAMQLVSPYRFHLRVSLWSVRTRESSLLPDH
jgi:hypothetical protein